MKDKKYRYYFYSLSLHLILVIALVTSIDFSSPQAVIENTAMKDVISAVALGDTPKTKIMPIKPVEPEIVPKQIKIKPVPKKAIVKKEIIKKEVIAIKKETKKTLQKKIIQEDIAKEFLADLKKQKEKQKKINQKLLKSQFEKTLRQQLLNEEIHLKGSETRQSQGEVNKYKALIIQAISQNWLIPMHANKSLYCELLIRLAPGGMVLDVQISKSSGDPSLDSSARMAVLKSSPLPVPSDAKAFEAFRQFALKVKPENILANSG